MYDEFARWLVSDKRLSPRTALIYTRRLRQAREQLGFVPEEHNAYQTWMWVQERGGSPSNQDSWVGFLQKYQEFCVAQGREAGFADDLKLARRPRDLPKPLSEEDIQAMLDMTPLENPMGLRDRAIMEMLYCNLRNSEVCNTKLQDYRNKEVRVLGKGSKERIVPVNDTAWEAVLRWAIQWHGGVTPPDDVNGLEDTFTLLRHRLQDEDRFMFQSAEGNPLTDRRVREIVEAAAKRAGLNPAEVHPHRFRHSFATHVLDHGATNLFALRDVMGHSSLTTTARYVKVSKAGRNQILAFHPRQK